MHQGFVTVALKVTAIGMACYHLAYTQVILQEPTGHRITHLGLALVVVCLSFLHRGKGNRLLNWVMLITSVAFTTYYLYYLQDILYSRTVMPLPSDFVAGVLALIIVYVVNYFVYGKTLLIVASVFVTYLVLGRYAPYPLTVAPVSWQMLLVWFTIPGLEEGIFGFILGISAKYLFLFIFFGALLHGFGATRFIVETGRWIGSKLVSGPAAVAVIASSLLGSITGSTSANIAITGSFTIPMMKDGGYSPEQAGAIESVASNGGQIMPPVLGAAAFIMAGLTGIPYIHLAMAAIIPALLYYGCIFLYVQLTASKMRLKTEIEPVNAKKLLLDAPAFVVPLAVLVALLARGFTLPYVAFWSMMSLIIVGLISSIRKEARLDIKQIVDAVAEGARIASEVGVIIGLVGIIATALTVSGVGILLPMLIQDISGGHLIVALLIAMVSSILLGMEVSTPVAYILVAIGLTPALLKMGVPLLQAHFFPWIFAVFAAITPPVATAPLVACRISFGNYWKTSWEACKAGFTAFLLPFFVIYSPIIILKPKGSLIISIAQLLAIILTIGSLQFAISNYCLSYLSKTERILFVFAGLACLVFIFTKVFPFFLGGLALFLPSILSHFRRRKVHVRVELG